MPLIAIESRDNIGKTTLIDNLKSINLSNTSFLAFPNENTASGQLTRRILSNTTPLCSNVLQTSFIINFYESIDLLLAHKTSPTQFLILDRYYYSTIAYTKASPTTSNHILKLLNELPEPDLLIYLDGEQRTSSVGDKHDTDTSYQNEVHAQFTYLLAKTPHQTIFNHGTPQDMTKQFLHIMAKTFKTFKYSNNIVHTTGVN